MRHKYRVDLYTDLPIDKEINDLLAIAGRGRRQEILRALLRQGYIAMTRPNSGGDINSASFVLPQTPHHEEQGTVSSVPQNGGMRKLAGGPVAGERAPTVVPEKGLGKTALGDKDREVAYLENNPNNDDVEASLGDGDEDFVDPMEALSRM